MYAEGMVLAGGGSVRMGGIHKGSLIYGKETFTQILVKELKKEVPCVRLSFGEEIRGDLSGCPVVMDIYPACGPIGGIYAGLKACTGEWMMIAACDMPFLKIEWFRYLKQQLRRNGSSMGKYDGAVAVTGGHIHPLAAIYRTRTADAFKAQIEEENYRVRDALERLDILYVDVTGKAHFEKMLRNINTMEDYARILSCSHGNRRRLP